MFKFANCNKLPESDDSYTHYRLYNDITPLNLYQYIYILVGGFNHLEKYESMGRMTSHIWNGKQNSWFFNHQPVYIHTIIGYTHWSWFFAHVFFSLKTKGVLTSPGNVSAPVPSVPWPSPERGRWAFPMGWDQQINMGKTWWIYEIPVKLSKYITFSWRSRFYIILHVAKD